jgi:hypothetical protein
MASRASAASKAPRPSEASAGGLPPRRASGDRGGVLISPRSHTSGLSPPTATASSFICQVRHNGNRSCCLPPVCRLCANSAERNRTPLPTAQQRQRETPYTARLGGTR